MPAIAARASAGAIRELLTGARLSSALLVDAAKMLDTVRVTTVSDVNQSSDVVGVASRLANVGGGGAQYAPTEQLLVRQPAVRRGFVETSPLLHLRDLITSFSSVCACVCVGVC